VAESPVLLGNVMQVLAFRGEPADREVLETALTGLDPLLAEALLLDFDANVSLVAGRAADAIAAATRLAALSPQSAPSAFVVAAHAATWTADLPALRRAADGLAATRVRGAELDAARVAIHAAVDALEGRRAESVAGYREALGRLSGHGLRLTQMLVGIGVAATLGAGSPDTAALVDETRDVMTELRAAALLDRLDDALARHEPVGTPASSTASSTAPLAPVRETS
jgi:hypothetical protein